MKKNKKILKRKEKGITLIALVITIIVLLILAGVSIAMLTGDNGILTQARNAKEETEKASELEGIQLAVIGSETKDNEYLDILDEESFQKELEKHFGSEKLDVVANGDGSFIITINDRKYYVNDDKTVIDSDNVIEIGQDDFEKFRDNVNNGNSYEGKVVLLTSDINLSDETLSDTTPNESWTPIGIISPDTENTNPETVDNKPFKGIFDGGNHTIKNLNINSTDNKYNGLFSFVVDGTIRNITIGENSEISGSNGAGVVGFLYGFEGNISNCVNYANTNGGGIVRYIAGQHTIYNCKNYGTINSKGAAGGIVCSGNGVDDWPDEFKNYSNKIINCGNYGTVTANHVYCGGIAGYSKASIINCCNKGDLTSTTGEMGGIVGNIDGVVQNCYNIGNVTSGGWYVGGIVGSGGISLGTQIINAYSKGNIVGNTVGDILGGHIPIAKEEDKIINCFGKDDTFTYKDLGDAFKEDTGENGGYPMLKWE